MDPEEEKKLCSTTSEKEMKYELPDGNIVNLNAERYRVPEVLFDPMLMGKELPGIHASTYKCINACDVDLRRSLYANIILSGGTTMFPGIEGRLSKELKAMAPQKIDVKVIANPERRYVVWIGASIVAQLSRFSEMLIHKQEYDEIGPGVVHQKCF